MGFWTQKHVVLGVGGGIAAYKTLMLIRLLRDAGARVTPVMTEAAKQFVTPVSLQALAGEPVHDDLFSAEQEDRMGHIALARAADLAVVAPATADLLARMAQGMANDLLTALLLARRGPVLAAPGMNTAMWEHPATRRNVATLIADGIQFVGPESGALACGESGAGRMSEPADILEAMVRALSEKPLAGKRILITAGPTREELDPVRYLSNHSSGKMGWAAANAALRAGAEVILIHGPTALTPPRGAEAVAVVSAREMEAAANEAWPRCHGAVLTAAVSDFRPRGRQELKIKKREGETSVTLDLMLNPDILAGLTARKRPDQTVMGFAAETGPNAVALAREKLARKGCDLLVVNDVLEAGSGFGVDTNRVTILSADGGEEAWPHLDKEEVGVRLIQTLAARLNGG